MAMRHSCSSGNRVLLSLGGNEKSAAVVLRLKRYFNVSVQCRFFKMADRLGKGQFIDGHTDKVEETREAQLDKYCTSEHNFVDEKRWPLQRVWKAGRHRR